VPVGEEGKEKGLALEFTETEKVFDPKEVYGDAPNPTKL
jgi:phosphoribosyl-AMP cyclohydrolase